MKAKTEAVDGLSAKDIERIRVAIRKVWMWSTPRRLVIKRCLGEDGFSVCELCKQKTPNLKVDHIHPVGRIDQGFIERLFCSSSQLQGLCKKCHDFKTKQEKKKTKT